MGYEKFRTQMVEECTVRVRNGLNTTLVISVIAA